MKKQPSANQNIKIEIDQILEKFDCVICMCKMSKPTITKCGHSFCKECILEVINQKHECPLCMHKLNKEDTVMNFALESLLQQLEEQKEEEAKKYFDNLTGKVVKGIDELYQVD
jgi:hypothetical protein